MLLDLSKVPFSTRGSYMALSWLGKEFQGEEIREGLYFRTVHGSAASSLLARIVPENEGKELKYDIEARPEEVLLKAEGNNAGSPGRMKRPSCFMGTCPLPLKS